MFCSLSLVLRPMVANSVPHPEVRFPTTAATVSLLQGPTEQTLDTHVLTGSTIEVFPFPNRGISVDKLRQIEASGSADTADHAATQPVVSPSLMMGAKAIETNILMDVNVDLLC